MAIKIIKPGNKPETTERFECPRCGCVFEADRDDVQVKVQLFVRDMEGDDGRKSD